MGKRKYSQFESLMWVPLGVVFCILAIKLGLGNFRNPGPGLFPFLTGSLLGFLGLVLALYKVLERQERKDEIEFSIRNFGKKGIYSLIALFMYAFLLEPLGFIITHTLLLFFLFKIMEPRKTFTPILIAVPAAILGYLVFCVWLRIDFPKGFLGIG